MQRSWLAWPCGSLRTSSSKSSSSTSSTWRSTIAAVLFAVFFVSITLAKIIHLSLHLSSLATTSFLIYLPSLFIPDILLFCLLWILLNKTKGAVISHLGFAIGTLLTLVTLGASSAQLGFWAETGGEMQWGDVRRFARDPDVVKMLLSGLFNVLRGTAVILVLSWVLQTPIGFCMDYLWNTAVGHFLTAGHAVAARARNWQKLSTHLDTVLPLRSRSTNRSVSSLAEYDNEDDDYGHQEIHNLLGESNHNVTSDNPKTPTPSIPPCLWSLAVTLFLLVTTVVRPHQPYMHLSTTVPLPMLDIFQPRINYCYQHGRILQNKWPFPEMIEKSKWEPPRGNFKGWAPGSRNSWFQKYRDTAPEWLPKPAPPGFFRFDIDGNRDLTRGFEQWGEEIVDDLNGTLPRKCGGQRVEEELYNPVGDPLKISNLDKNVLEPLQKAFDDHSVKIKHVAIIMMESMRYEMFPLQQGSTVHKYIMDTHGDNAEEKDRIQRLLAQLTPNSEKISGRRGNFHDSQGNPLFPDAESNWEPIAKEGYGGITVNGAVTPSSFSVKSMQSSHCGVWPVAMDLYQEAQTQSYQPCITHIMNLLNRLKGNSSTTTEDFREQKWSSAFFQPAVDTIGLQRRGLHKMAFGNMTVARDVLDDLKGDHERFKYHRIGPMGFDESSMEPYMRAYLEDITKNNERMLLSHFTIAPHYEWHLPERINMIDHMGTSGHEQLNGYVNTIRFHDRWLGRLMSLFAEFGIADETLVVFIGDHGYAFEEDGGTSGPYNNGAIANFRVPLTFYHPNLPRFHYNVNVTSVSVVPTILDLLVQSDSLNSMDATVASDLIHDYEGQSLIRPYQKSKDGRRAWNFSTTNPGGLVLVVTSADAPWKLTVPLKGKREWVLTNLADDPLESNPVSGWVFESFLPIIQSAMGPDAALWAKEAKMVADWWYLERKRLWNTGFLLNHV